MTNKNSIEKLKALGFKEYEAKVFLVLLKGVPMSASAIAKEANIIRNSIYDILKSFVEKGYCNEIETNTILNYQIIDPQIILDKIKKSYHDSFNTNLSLLTNTFDELQPIYKSAPKDRTNKDLNIELIRGFNKHRVAKYAEILKHTEFEVLGMYRLNGTVSEELDSTAEKLIRNGGTVKSIYMATLDFKVVKDGKAIPANHEDLVRVLETFEKYGEKVRISKVKIPNITIFDKTKVFINISDKDIPKNKRADIIVSNPDLAEHMTDLFNYYWEKGITIEEYKKSLNK
jgi:sugar-specific transcriptional regulator TrmB